MNKILFTIGTIIAVLFGGSMLGILIAYVYKSVVAV